MIEYVDLKRNFVAIDKNSEPELRAGWLWGGSNGGWLKWSDLLDHDRVVLLAEAASGKSEEFKHTAAGMRTKGNVAFYTTIEQLTDSGLSLGPELRPLWDSWKAGSEHAWFFLDSVDEARLNQKKFETALRALASEIGPTLARVRILVSCRVSDWRGKSDRQTLLEILPVSKPPPQPPVVIHPDAALLDPIFERKPSENPTPADKSPKKPDLLVVQLVPLTNDQRRAIAGASGITDADTFLRAIERQGLDVLAERPGDILELAQYWIDQKTFGTLTAMTEAAVTTKLRELDRYRPDNTQLTPGQAHEGADQLAAGLTLAKTFTLIASGQEVDPSLSAGALDPAELLDNWSVAQCNALVRRAIFAPSTYGQSDFIIARPKNI